MVEFSKNRTKVSTSPVLDTDKMAKLSQFQQKRKRELFQHLPGKGNSLPVTMVTVEKSSLQSYINDPDV